ncbi:MAG: prephenate dehydratase [Candidatus Tokpelaia sp. JSC085]|nr:MAG: prephenate dehydratase [Candidatus Tokpelaia sp. JSC085]
MDRKNKIAFQGEYGANSDTACRNMHPDMNPLPCTTFEDTFKAVQSGAADLAMIPIENTLAGRVADIHNLLPHSNLFIIEEYFLPIHFHLMVFPGVKREEIKTVHSHIHALGQCRNIIRENGWKAVIAEDTAGAAKLIRQAGNRSMAALAPYLAAGLYGLDILQKNVEDSSDNVTRFIVLSREEQHPVYHDNGKRIITSLIFSVRNVPAGLYKSLSGFATGGINITKLESYQIRGAFQDTQFYAEIEGHPEEHLVKLALEELDFFAGAWRIVGVYPAHPFRQQHNLKEVKK